MGLRQAFRFHYESPKDVEMFLEGLTDSFSVKKADGLYIISQKEGKPFEFEALVEDYGLRTDRAGEYFEFVGIFVEKITGQFGSVEIEDI